MNKHGAWYMTSDEYFQLLKDCLQDYESDDTYQWHVDDLRSNLDAIQDTIHQVFNRLILQERVARGMQP